MSIALDIAARSTSQVRPGDHGQVLVRWQTPDGWCGRFVSSAGSFRTFPLSAGEMRYRPDREGG